MYFGLELTKRAFSVLWIHSIYKWEFFCDEVCVELSLSHSGGELCCFPGIDSPAEVGCKNLPPSHSEIVRLTGSQEHPAKLHFRPLGLPR
ncbi:hypothetical protein TNCT_82461 [Trichonephila clavata]|uniref:Uncharacterized protein n=1 Tax=Trichonephila clavata TaxID=2740835 RepID=A0A8X6GZA8_TRICU|nr:hypothetical protein TNCT_82461 [Trichonephila clavata]